MNCHIFTSRVDNQKSCSHCVVAQWLGQNRLTDFYFTAFMASEQAQAGIGSMWSTVMWQVTRSHALHCIVCGKGWQTWRVPSVSVVLRKTNVSTGTKITVIKWRDDRNGTMGDISVSLASSCRMHLTRIGETVTRTPSTTSICQRVINLNAFLHRGEL